VTPEDRQKSIIAGYTLAALPLLPGAQAELEAMTDEQIILDDHEQTVIIESPLATSASVIAAAAHRIRLLSELVRRRSLTEQQG
jgi:hypothetical protein